MVPCHKVNVLGCSIGSKSQTDVPVVVLTFREIIKNKEDFQNPVNIAISYDQVERLVEDLKRLLTEGASVAGKKERKVERDECNKAIVRASQNLNPAQAIKW